MWPWKNRSEHNAPDSRKVLYLFPDTNFFIQCLLPEQLDWSSFTDFDEVVLIVTRPVQKEIDWQKNRGGDRLGKRARKIASVFRSVVQNEVNELTVRDASPVVKLRLRVDLRPDNPPDNRLDMSEADDKLVAITQAFARTQPRATVRLLSGDSGPMASAHMVGVPLEVIRSEWLLPPESDGRDKAIRRLETEVQNLRKAEPQFEITCKEADEGNGDGVDMSLYRYRVLDREEISKLVDNIRERCPIVIEFGEKEKFAKASMFGFSQLWKPATQTAIDEYREAYESWLSEIEEALASIHHRMNADVDPGGVTIEIANTGSRPGRDALIEIEARGEFKLRVPASSEGDDREALKPPPAPPVPPTGQWVTARISDDGSVREIGSMQSMMRGLQDFHASFSANRFLPHNFPDISGPTPRNPNGFYYKPTRPTFQTDTVILECPQWRHSTGPEPFHVEIVFPSDSNEIDGAIDVRVHAENLTTIMPRCIPIQAMRNEKSVFELAGQWIASVDTATD